MPLSDHLELMQRLCAKAGQGHECPFEKHFLSGIMSLKEFSTDYDAIVDEHNPFYQEFTKYLNQDALETDDLFSLFECLVIFIRMRQMARSGLELSPKEQSVLDYFESCGEWASRDNTLVSNWYWKQLPGKQRSH
ncbi:hypothetical protein [uncultured Desulfovibrio sp.]|uniref:hypothetical protein n=1 Tax=uncultured Desulfovibrio sp. TaxID=167968 RepID=UPI0026286874|nr:hypothetical protein [uncultured Desulfovibrio sp.]